MRRRATLGGRRRTGTGSSCWAGAGPAGDPARPGTGGGLLLKTRRDVAVQPLLRAWLDQVKPGRGVRVDVDVDPVSFL